MFSPRPWKALNQGLSQSFQSTSRNQYTSTTISSHSQFAWQVKAALQKHQALFNKDSTKMKIKQAKLAKQINAKKSFMQAMQMMMASQKVVNGETALWTRMDNQVLTPQSWWSPSQCNVCKLQHFYWLTRKKILWIIYLSTGSFGTTKRAMLIFQWHFISLMLCINFNDALEPGPKIFCILMCT